MKRFATGLLVVAAIVFVAMKVIDPSGTWAGYVQAIAEAAMVGAIADWFAVTALFRHPLGLPIPHTAIIPTRKDDIGKSLGDFVESNFLTTEVIDQRLRGAEIGKRAGAWLADDSHAERAADAMADVLRGALEVLDDTEIQKGIERVVQSRIDTIDAAPLFAKVLDATVEGGHHQRLLDSVLVGLSGFMADNRATFQRRIYEESPSWVPKGIDDRVLDKIYTAVGRFMTDIAASPNHEVRQTVDQRAHAYAARLRDDPALTAKGQELKVELLAHPEVRSWIDSLWSQAKQALLTASDDKDSELRLRVTESLKELGTRLATEPELQAKVDAWVSQAVAHLVENYRTEVSDIISSTVEKWDANATAEKIELQVGRDLQFIRINGTVVGGLAGLVIHAVGQVL
ncbi:MAG: uncharacterized membrane-anchored protein YjiN (DUF445 family) [Candidatus Aldehydirespiratoraceae bacterium]|jgi:uncharacterized membrane-anchored protein YjiN (DUF445 family)